MRPVGAVLAAAIMMAVAADRSRKRAAEIVVGVQAANQRSDVVARRPAELGARLVVEPG